MHQSRRLRAVPEHGKTLVIDPPMLNAPDDDEVTDDWRTGWRACREVLGHEVRDAYARGMRATPARPLVTVGHAVSVTAAFCVGFVLAIAFFA